MAESTQTTGGGIRLYRLNHRSFVNVDLTERSANDLLVHVVFRYFSRTLHGGLLSGDPA